jgi:uncharacterized membrane protein YobD (UPF0266 family)
MRKEIQAIEWVLLISGIILLWSGSVYLLFFIRLFQVYFFLMTFGMGLWIAVRYFKRYKKKNIVIFHLKKRDELAGALIIKSIQLLAIVSMAIMYRGEDNLFIPVAVAFIYFAIQVGKFGQPKLVFHSPNLYKDAIFFEQLEVSSFDIYEDGIVIHEEKEVTVLFDELDATKFRNEVEFEENQILDDILLTDGDNEITRNFINEIEQYATKLEIPIQQKQGKITHE